VDTELTYILLLCAVYKLLYPFINVIQIDMVPLLHVTYPIVLLLRLVCLKVFLNKMVIL